MPGEAGRRVRGGGARMRRGLEGRGARRGPGRRRAGAGGRLELAKLI